MDIRIASDVTFDSIVDGPGLRARFGHRAVSIIV